MGRITINLREETVTGSEAVAGKNTTLRKLRPIWLNLALMAASLILLAILIFALFFPDGTLGQVARGGGKALPLLLFTLLVAAVIFYAFGGINIVKTIKHRGKASYRREETEGRLQIYHTTPTRISLVTLLFPLVTGASCYLLISFLALGQEAGSNWASLYSLVGFTILLIAIVVTLCCILPGARYRKPAVIAITPHAVETEDMRLSFEDISGFDMICITGIEETSEPIRGREEGIADAVVSDHGLTGRMAARNFMIRAHREDRMDALPLAGGLTEDCARRLLDDIVQVTGKTD